MAISFQKFHFVNFENVESFLKTMIRTIKLAYHTNPIKSSDISHDSKIQLQIP